MIEKYRTKAAKIKYVGQTYLHKIFVQVKYTVKEFTCFYNTAVSKWNKFLLIISSPEERKAGGEFHQIQQTILHILKFILGTEAWGNKTKEMYH